MARAWWLHRKKGALCPYARTSELRDASLAFAGGIMADLPGRRRNSLFSHQKIPVKEFDRKEP